MKVESVSRRQLLVAPLRIVLGIGFLVGARAVGLAEGPAFLLFGAGAFATAFLISNDPRARFRGAGRAPTPLPSDAQIAPAWLHAAHACLPSTVGLAVLAGFALSGQADLAALLAGALAGLGLVALLYAYRIDPALYVEARSGWLFLQD